MSKDDQAYGGSKPSAPAVTARGTQVVNARTARGTQVLGGSPVVEAKPDASVKLGVARKGRDAEGLKVDVAKADPRRMPTRVAPRRAAPQPTSEQPAQQGPTRTQWWAAALGLLVTLLLGAAVLWFIAHRQRAGAP
ncbi:MAG: hypothetical protein HOW73_41130 [Polyangiaceae bacterium]|nr:hypothetical protein [Polyangiaceae bacterium]